MKRMPNPVLLAALIPLACATLSDEAVSTHGANSSDRFAIFEPEPDGRADPIDYDGVDEVLGRIVLATGPSLRRRASRPLPFTGSRFVIGHDSPWRLEGNRVAFSRLDDAHKEAIFFDTESLIAAGQEIPIARLPSDAQLAYWMNLHNMLVISELLKRYPVREPRRLTIGPDNLPFHSAPMLEIQGVKLSLEDIRTRIVYRYWPDAKVMYGFFHGDLMSPNIRSRAFRGANVWEQLESNAREFVNALRGVHRQDKAMRVSPLYAEARPFFFPDWPNDLRQHLHAFANRPVTRILQQTSDVEVSHYEGRIADIVGGRPFRPTTAVSAPSDYALMMVEFRRKFGELSRRGIPRGSVEITDLPDDEPDEEEKP